MQPGGRQPEARSRSHGLEETRQLAADCKLCRLCNTRSHVVFGSGDPEARLMFVSEGPGYHEDRGGEPFVGAAGELFDELLASISIARSDVYVTSVVKCRPPRNRTPFPDEIEQCEGYLFRQVTSVQPDVICTLGNVAIKLLTDRAHRLSKVHGQTFEVAIQGRPVTVLPLYHPAAAGTDSSLLATLREDIRLLPALLRSEVDAEPTPSLAAEPELAPTAAASSAGAGKRAIKDDQMTLKLG